MGVMAFHAGTPFLKGGFIGVDVFFVISGFLITRLLSIEFSRSNTLNLKHFYIRRFLRLTPALIVMLFTTSILSMLFLDRSRAESNVIDAIIAAAYLSNWARAFSVHAPDIVGHTWSLSIEEQFYLMWPCIFLLAKKCITRPCVIALGAACIGIASWVARCFLFELTHSPERVYNGLDTRLDGLMFGCVIGILFSDASCTMMLAINHKALRYCCAISIIALLIMSVFCRWTNSWMIFIGYLASGVLTSIIIVSILELKESFVNSNRILTFSGIVWIGKISYGFYLWHYPVYRILQACGFRGLVVITFGTAITFGIAALSFYAIEMPFLRLKKHFGSASPELSR